MPTLGARPGRNPDSVTGGSITTIPFRTGTGRRAAVKSQKIWLDPARTESLT